MTGSNHLQRISMPIAMRPLWEIFSTDGIKYKNQDNMYIMITFYAIAKQYILKYNLYW